jgi:hypothetical protein
MSFSAFLAIALTLGPAVAIPYGLGFMSAVEIYVTLFLLYMLPLPPLFYIMGKIEGRDDYRNIVLNHFVGFAKRQAKKVARSYDAVFRLFNKRYGDLGYELSVGLVAFSVGVIWASAFAFIMRLPRRRAYVAIGGGTLAGLLFWMFVTLQSVAFVDAQFFAILVLILAGEFYFYGRYRERQMLRACAECVVKKE